MATMIIVSAYFEPRIWDKESGDEWYMATEGEFQKTMTLERISIPSLSLWIGSIWNEYLKGEKVLSEQIKHCYDNDEDLEVDVDGPWFDTRGLEPEDNEVLNSILREIWETIPRWTPNH